MPIPPELPKSTWTDADFDEMGWHDNVVHAIAFEPAIPYPGRVLLDIDYIIEWVHPVHPERTFSFWICPATLVFDKAWNLTSDIALQGSFTLSLDAIDRTGPDKHGAYEWTLDGHEFTLTLHSPGYTQHLRRPPILSREQRLTPSERGGIAFDRTSFPVPTPNTADHD